jgi:hypothetical protein
MNGGKLAVCRTPNALDAFYSLEGARKGDALLGYIRMSGTETAILSRLGLSYSNVKYVLRVYMIHDKSMVLLVLVTPFARLLNTERVYLEIADRKPPDHLYSIMESLRKVLKPNLILEFIYIAFGNLKKGRVRSPAVT